jgi:hypothetical protein
MHIQIAFCKKVAHASPSSRFKTLGFKFNFLNKYVLNFDFFFPLSSFMDIFSLHLFS